MNFMAVSETTPEPQDRSLPARRLLVRANVYIAFALLLAIAEIAYGRLFDIPIGASVAVLLVLLTAVFLRYVPFGRYIFAVGSDEGAARLMGLPRDRVIVFVYAFSGFCSALTAIFLVARFGVGQPYA